MKRVLPFLLALLLLLIVSACDEPTDTPTPTCSVDQLVEPLPGVPNYTTVTVRNPELSWIFDADCEVENFHFAVSTDALMNDPDLSGDTHAHYLGFSTGIEYLDEDCTNYYWQVTAEAAGASIESPVATFYTNFTGTCPELPACTETPTAPIARSPWGGEIVTDVHPQLVWEHADADCAIDSYHFEVAEEPSFSTLKIFGNSHGLEFYTGIPFLEDCETYFWRVTAQSAAGNATSNIIQFWTDFEGTCPRIPMCSEAELVAPSLLDPIGGESVNIPNPELIYQFNTPDCAPETSEFWVSSDPDFSTYALHGTGDYDTATYPDAMIFGTGIEFLDDCTTYYWKVQVTAGATTLTSPVETFETNFSGTCGAMPMPDLGLTFADLFHLKSFNIGCIDFDSMYATFVFEEAIQGNYEARIGKLRTWPCALLQGHDNGLICSGPAVSQGVDVQVDLFSLDTQEVVLNLTGFSELCEGAQARPTDAPQTACQPPAGGCPKNTWWCQSFCQCNTSPCP